MTRSLLPRHRIGLAIALLLPMIGCGGTSSVSVGVPTDTGPQVTGRVSMPNGQIARLPSALERLAQAMVARVEALTAASVHPVGAGIEVRLVRIGPENIVDGQIKHGSEAVLSRTNTLDGGGYTTRLKTSTDYETCRYMLEVGSTSDRTLTRAFVFDKFIDVDFESETTVRLILEQIANGQTSLCALTADDIRLIHDSVHNSNGVVFGNTAAAVNSSALIAAQNDPAVLDAVAQAVGVPTPPPATDTVGPEPTATVPPPTATAPRATDTAGPTRTNTTRPTGTPSRPPTRTETPEPTQTTAEPTATVPLPTNTVAPSNTVPPNTATPLATNTPAVPTASVTRTFTATVQPTATATQPLPRVDLGSIAGPAGQTIELPVSLVTNGATIAAVSNDIEYDATRLDVVVGATGPDCTIDSRLAGTKSVVARVTTVSGGRKRLRVGVIGTTNNQSIAGGPLYSCRFAIDIGAAGAQALLNMPEAADPQAVAVAVTGNAGSINVTAAPSSLGLSAGTAAAGGTVAITATLNGHGQPLAAVGTDIHFDPDLVTVADNDHDGAPDCTIDAGVAGLGKEIAAVEIAPAGDDAVLRVGIVGRANAAVLPDIGPLFTCNFVVQAASGTIALSHVAEGASPVAQPVGLQAQPGSITVQ